MALYVIVKKDVIKVEVLLQQHGSQLRQAASKCCWQSYAIVIIEQIENFEGNGQRSSNAMNCGHR